MATQKLAIAGKHKNRERDVAMIRAIGKLVLWQVCPAERKHIIAAGKTTRSREG